MDAGHLWAILVYCVRSFGDWSLRLDFSVWFCSSNNDIRLTEVCLAWKCENIAGISYWIHTNHPSIEPCVHHSMRHIVTQQSFKQPFKPKAVVIWQKSNNSLHISTIFNENNAKWIEPQTNHSSPFAFCSLTSFSHSNNPEISSKISLNQ